MTTQRPLVVVLGSGYHLYREYLMAGIACHADIWLLTPRPVAWEARYIVGHTIVDLFDTDAVLRAGAAPDTRTIDGVISWDELLVHNAARLADAIGVPGPTPDAVDTCRNKGLTRQALAACDVAQPRSRRARSLAEAQACAQEIGFPVVIKPRTLGASIGVTRVHHPGGVPAAYHHASTAYEDGNPADAEVLVEECVIGDEISIDCSVVKGCVVPLFLARKMLGFGDACEEVGHTVAADEPLLHDPAILDLLTRAHQAVGYDTGVTHTEVMMTAWGPRLIEINARLGGDLIPWVATQATGIDIGAVAVNVALGRQPSPVPCATKVARIDFLYPVADCVVDHIDMATEVTPGIVECRALATTGQALTLPPVEHVSGRYGYVISTAAFPDELPESEAILGAICLVPRVPAEATA